LAIMRGNFATMKVLAGPDAMQDPTLRPRLKDVRIPALVVWGESDRVVTPSYGRAYAEAFGDGRFVAIPECGHLPQIEQPGRLMAALQTFLEERRAT
jgi:pimeloyl-ACP methyl ester carboxylesterase